MHIAKESRPLAYAVAVLIMLLYLALWPVQILHYSENTVNYVKTPYLITLFIVLAILVINQKFKISIVFTGLLLCSIAIIFSINNGVIISAYMYRSLLYILLCTFFYAYPEFIKVFVVTLISVSVSLSTLSILAFILTYFDFPIIYESVSFVDSGRFDSQFSFLFGFEIDKNYYRSTSYFSESNKFAYFLTPSFVISYIWHKKSYFHLASFFIISIAIILTFSVFTFLIIILTLLLYKYDNATRKRFAFSGFRFLVGFFFGTAFCLLMYYIYTLSPEYFLRLMDKTGSIRIRLLGIRETLEIVAMNNFGIPKSMGWEGEGNTTLALMYWLKYGGLQAMLPLIILIYIWFRNCRTVMKSTNLLYSSLAYGLFAYLLQQSFFGDYYEYLFLGIMAILTSIYASSTKVHKLTWI